MKYAWLAALASGCSFAAMPGEVVDDGEPPDAMQADDGATLVRRCADPSTRLCIDFEEMAPVRDELGGVISEVNVQPEPRGAQQAASLWIDSQLAIAEHPRLDITTNLTIEMWMKPDLVPLSGSFGLLDNDGQYELTYEGDGEVQCRIGGEPLDSGRAIYPGAWHHVACTFEDGDLRIYLDGALRACQRIASTIPTTGALGTAIGAELGTTGISGRFLGDLDNVRIHARTLGAQEICDIHGGAGSSCADECPSFDGGSGPG